MQPALCHVGANDLLPLTVFLGALLSVGVWRELRV